MIVVGVWADLQGLTAAFRGVDGIGESVSALATANASSGLRRPTLSVCSDRRLGSVVRIRSLLSLLFLLLMLAAFLTEMAFSLFLHFPGFLTDLGASAFDIGVLYAVAAAVAIALRPWMGRLVDQRDRRWVIIAAGVVSVSALLAYLTIDTFGVSVFVVAIVNTSAQVLLATAFFAFAADIVPPSRRTQGLALFGISFMLPIGLGSILGEGILAIADFDVIFLTAALFEIGSIAIVLTLSEPHREHDSTRRSFFAALRQEDLRPLWWLTFFVALGVTTLFTFMRTFVDETGIGSVGLFFGAFAFTAVLVRVSASWLPDRVGQKRVLGPAVAAYSAAFGLLAAAGSTVDMVVAAILAGAAHGFIFPIISSLIVTRSRASERGSAIAIHIAILDVAILAGGPTVGAMIEHAGYPTAFATVGVAVAVGTIGFFVWDDAKRNAARGPESTAKGSPPPRRITN